MKYPFTYRSLVRCMTVLFCTAPLFAVEIDWEAEITKANRATAQYRHLGERKSSDAGFEAFARRFPDSPEAAIIQRRKLTKLFTDKQWQKYLDQATVWLEQNDYRPAVESGTLYELGRLLHAQDASEEEKARAFELLLPRLKHRAWLAGYLRNYILKLPGEPASRYATAQKVLRACGEPSPASMAPNIWGFITPMLTKEGDADALAAVKQFLTDFGEEHAEGRAAKLWLLKQEGKQEEATALKEENKKAKEASDALLKKLREAIDGEDTEATLMILQQWMRETPKFERATGWSQIQNVISTADPSLSVAVWEAGLEDLPPSSNLRESAFKAILGRYRMEPESADKILKVLALLDDDRGRVESQWNYALQSAPALAGPVRTRALLAAAKAMESLEMEELQFDDLYEAARSGWTYDREDAIQWLRKVAPSYQRYASGAKAGWLLAMLEGRHSLIMPPTPRAPESPAKTETAYPLVQKKTVRPFVESRTTFDPNVDLVDAEKATTLDGKSVSFQTGAWKPVTLPATLYVPLKQEATIDRIEVDAENSTHLIVSILGRDGRVLARQEREWGFWENLPSAHLQPENKVRFRFPPVDGASQLRLEVYHSETEAAIQRVSAYATPHPLLEWVVNKPMSLPVDAKGIAVDAVVTEPEHTIIYLFDGDETLGFPLMRWDAPWRKFGKQPINLRMTGGNVALHFYGDAASVEVVRAGGLHWQLRGGAEGEIMREKAEPARYLLTKNIPSGLQILSFGSEALPEPDNAYGPNDAQPKEITVVGHARANLGIRFSEDGKQWSAWYGPLNAPKEISIPELANGKRPRFFQTGTQFDSRTVRGERSAEVVRFNVEPVIRGGSEINVFPEEESSVKEELEEAARLLASRTVTVVYSKEGEGYASAQKLADHARVYLVSDDLGLNLYPALPLTVGTPLRNRYARQLVATHALWRNADYLNDPNGRVLIARDRKGNPSAIHVIGETPEAVARAAERLLKATPAPAQVKTPFRLFASSTLERVHGWDLRPERPALDGLEVVMGRSDKRSVQFGLAAETELKDFEYVYIPLKGPDGAVLPKESVTLRAASFYEWIPFFGDLRLPNTLTEKPLLPIPDRTAIGLWATIRTPQDLPPGIYKGEIRVTSNGHSEEIPLRVEVVPVNVPLVSTIPTFSFAQVPYWFAPGTPLWETAVVALAENEAAQGVSHLSGTNDFSAIKMPSFLPARQRVETDGSTDETWKRSQAQTALRAGESLVLSFAHPVETRLVTVGVEKADESGVWILEAEKNGKWEELSRTPLEITERGALVFKVHATLQTIRLRPEKAGGTVATVRLFESEKPATFDFSTLARQMDLVDAVYQKRGLPLPSFIVQSPNEIMHIATAIFGISEKSGLATRWYADDLMALVEKSGRKERFLYKVGDEPGDIEEWAAYARPFHAAGLRTMTCHSDRYPHIDIAVGLLEPWVPNYQHNVDLKFFRDRQKAGDRLWWYICGVPVTRLTGSQIENLPFYWLTAKWNLQGAMNYAAMHSSDFVMPIPFRYEHGMDHRILFQPDGSVLDTTRRELEGDGIRDMELIFMIRRQLEKMTDQTKAKKMGEQLDALLTRMVPYKYGYSQEPKVWENARKELYRLASQSME